MHDPMFAARMAYVGPKGIPLSEFLTWDTHDQEAALLWQAHEARRCGQCRTHPWDWNPDKGGRRQAYTAEVVQCPGCAAVAVALDQHQKVLSSVKGMMVRLRPAE